MKKRAFAVFFAFFSLFAFIGVRLYSVSVMPEAVSYANASSSIVIKEFRGNIYDCNMIPMTDTQSVLYAAAKPSEKAIASLMNAVSEETFDYARERMASGRPVTVKIEKPIIENDDIRLITVPERYGDSSFACHIIGYLNSSGEGISGIEKAYDTLLSAGESELTVRFAQNANGGVLMGEEITVEGNAQPKSGVVLTIDSRIQQIAEEALDNSGFECSAAVVTDIENGAIRACVSRPAFNQNDIAAYLENENSPLINRAFLPFSVGSVFKPIVAAAAMESGIDEKFEYNCTGSTVCNGVTFNCHKSDGHGVTDMQGAVANSCNTYFIALAIETGAENIIETASDFGFGRETVLADSIVSSKGNLADADELDSQAAIANISFGQGSLLATPLQICSAMAAIAREGVYITPYLIEGQLDAEGSLTRITRYTEKKQIISPHTAHRLCVFLEKVVTQGSGWRAASDCITVAGKTATAQTGKTENGEEIYNSWFAGYFPAENPRYAVTVLIENGGEGAVSCAPVFREIAENINKIAKS